jgi:hypothetical protein
LRGVNGLSTVNSIIYSTLADRRLAAQWPHVYRLCGWCHDWYDNRASEEEKIEYDSLWAQYS